MRAKELPPSLTHRTLLRIAVGVALIVVLSGAVTYYRIYQEIQQRVLEHLSQYTLQRSQSEAAKQLYGGTRAYQLPEAYVWLTF